MHNCGMIYDYARVSTAAQDETGQVRQLKAAGCEKVFREKITIWRSGGSHICYAAPSAICSSDPIRFISGFRRQALCWQLVRLA